jgi:hypothetical protein
VRIALEKTRACPSESPAGLQQATRKKWYVTVVDSEADTQHKCWYITWMVDLPILKFVISNQFVKIAK